MAGWCSDNNIVIGEGGLGFDFGAVKSNAALHRCDVSLDLNLSYLMSRRRDVPCHLYTIWRNTANQFNKFYGFSDN